jgi:Spy/CpxP family protein refolding chaperone
MERAFGMPGAQGRWWNNPRVVEALKLTEEQQKAMDGILMNHREKLIDLRASLQKQDLRMEELIADVHPEEGAIVAQIDKVAQARAELEKANARFLLAVWSKLTPEQKTQLNQLRTNGWQRGNWGQEQMRQRGMMRNRGAAGQNMPPTPPPPLPAPEAKQ